jgi:NB-ARC domain
VLLIAISTVLSVALAVAVNVATGGSLPEPFGQVKWLAWPLVAALAAALVVVGAWQAPRSERRHRAPRGAAAVRPAELPPDVSPFAAREADLAALLAAVPKHPKAGLGAPVIIGVFGAGGVGKTALATRLAHSVAARYPDGQLFVELRGASPEAADPAEVQRRILYALGMGAGSVPGDLAARQALYRSLLAERRVLLYLDDAASEEQVRPLLPAARGCLVVVTARPSLVGLSMGAWRDLDVLPERAAIALLAVSVGDSRVGAEPDAAAEVARQCGRLPLALGIAGARLRARPQWTVAELARRLADERRRLDELRIGDRDVRASIGLSYADLDPTTAQLFRLLSLLGYADFGRGVTSALLGGAEHLAAAEAALERLADAKLVEVAGPVRYRLHDLVRLFAAERLRDDEPAAERRAARRRALAYYARRTREEWARLAARTATADDRAQAEQWFQRSRAAIVAAVRTAVAADEPEAASQLAAAVAPYLEAGGYPVDLATVVDAAGIG